MQPSGVIAIVDDDQNLLESLSDLLRSYGMGVRTYASAMLLLQAGSLDGIDLLLTDIRMPEMDGLALKQEARSQNPDLPVIFMTGESMIANEPIKPTHGDSLVVRKPFKAEELLQALRRALGRHV